MIEKTINIKKRFDELTNLIADPKIIADQKEWKKLVKERASIEEIAEAHDELEKLLKDFACFLIESPNSTYKIQIFEALDVLLRNEIINRETYSIIDEFRRYRNALVHSLDTDARARKPA